MNDIVAGHLPVGWTSIASVTPHMQAGRVRVLAAAGASRTPFFPDAPTLAEAGIPGLALSGWVALLGPAAGAPARGDAARRRLLGRGGAGRDVEAAWMGGVTSPAMDSCDAYRYLLTINPWDGEFRAAAGASVESSALHQSVKVAKARGHGEAALGGAVR